MILGVSYSCVNKGVTLIKKGNKMIKPNQTSMQPYVEQNNYEKIDERILPYFRPFL